MSSTPPPGGPLFVEPLEARIAPTGLTALTNNLAAAGLDNYVQYNTAPSPGHLGFVLASTLGVIGNNLYAIKLTGDGSTVIGTDGLSHSTGDEIVVFNPVNGFNTNRPFLQATNGTLFAFFLDRNNDGQVQSDELVGIAMSKKGAATVDGTIHGDVVTNVTKDGTGIMLTSPGKAGFSLGGLTVTSNVEGSIYAGGNISGINVAGSVGNIVAGSATAGLSYNFTGIAGRVTGVLQTPAFKPLHVGASITGVQVSALLPGDRIQAGDGGQAAAGGSLTGIIIQADTDGYNLLAGNGGAGTDTLTGGAGGGIANVTLQGVALSQANHLITIKAGNGGDNPTFKAGIGGSISGVATSFDTFNATTNAGTISGDLLAQDFLIKAGDGGAGLRGGKGGDVLSSAIFGSIPDDGVVTNGVANPEIQVLSGNGGAATRTDAGHGSNGGMISQLQVENFDSAANALGSSELVQAGNGGAARSGGSLDSLTLLGTNLVLNAGNATDGNFAGGNGGSITNVNVLNLTNLFTHQLTLNAGNGSSSTSAGNGGFGGSINMVTMLDADLALLVVNSGTHGNGGNGATGTGGAGGSVTNLNLTASSVGQAESGVAAIRSGAGGSGLLGGGVGGDITDLQLLLQNTSYNLATGSGGNVLAGGSGVGGAGGSLLRVGVANQIQEVTLQVGQDVTSILPVAATGTATTGAGGAGTNGGGAGGTIVQSTLSAIGNLNVASGAGGAGGAGAAGAGGDMDTVTGISLDGSLSSLAGNGGTSGVLGGAGGSINAFVASAMTNISMVAGNGGNGGAGGNITASGTGANPVFIHTVETITPDGSDLTVNFTTSNFGNLTVAAGNGNTTGKVAGAGGNVSNFAGFVALNGTTAIKAGNGGGGAGDTASGAGGNLDTIKLMGNGTTDLATAQVVTIDAGSGGAASLAKRGAAGGNVNAVVIDDLDVGTVVHHVAAGDASAGVNKGANGGSITFVNVGTAGDTVRDDIGIRSGAAYGYAANQAGGIFAGLGTVGMKTGGINGSVSDITASAISSIVAGKGAAPRLVTNLDRISLEGVTTTAVNANGSFTNFEVANLVGSVQNPNAAGASTFKQGDGLIAAATIGAGLNFVPEAELTYDAAGNLRLVDPRQPAGTPVITNPPAFLL